MIKLVDDDIILLILTNLEGGNHLLVTLTDKWFRSLVRKWLRKEGRSEALETKLSSMLHPRTLKWLADGGSGVGRCPVRIPTDQYVLWLWTKLLQTADRHENVEALRWLQKNDCVWEALRVISCTCFDVEFETWVRNSSNACNCCCACCEALDTLEWLLKN